MGNPILQIINQIGQQVKNGNVSKSRIELNELPAGLYFIYITSDKGTSTKRFIKQ